MKELIRLQYGSKLYGTDTPKSDTDTKVLFLPDLKDILLGNKTSNKFNSSSGSGKKNSEDDTDIEFIPIQKFFKDFYEGQTYALEIAFAVTCRHKGVEYDDPSHNIYHMMCVMTANYVTNNVDSMVGYAMSQSYKYGIKGKRYEALVKLNDELATHWFNLDILSGESAVLKGALSKITTDGEYVRVDGDDLLVFDKKYQGTTHINEVQDRVKVMMGKFGDRTKETATSKNIDWKSVSHAVRISGMACQLLRWGKLEFPLAPDETALLKDIKAGLTPWDSVSDLISTRQDEIIELKKTTSLPPHSDELKAKYDNFVYSWLKSLYQINNV